MAGTSDENPETPVFTPPTAAEVMALLQGVIDPELGSNIVELGMAKSATIDDAGEVTLVIDLTIAGCPLKAQIKTDVTSRVATVPGVSNVVIEWGVLSDEEKAATMAVARKNAAERSAVTSIGPTTKVITIASGKGGVGKSSVTVNLAAGIAARGFAVGVIDADIGGFSIPRMLGLDGRLEGANSEDGEAQMVPHELAVGAGVLRVVSMGFLTEAEDTALAWRGQTLGRAVQHFLEDVQWGDLDYLIIDTPPGTGDIQMGLARMLPRAEMIVVTTPAVTAQKVAGRAITLARKHFLRVVGVVENMSAFVCEHGTTYELFGSGGGEALATEYGVPLLGSIPLDATVAHGGDTGSPVVGTATDDDPSGSRPAGPAAAALDALVDHVVTEAVPPVDLAGCTARLLANVEAALDAADAAAE